MESFTRHLRAMDGPELGLVVAVATHVRHQLEALNHSPSDPILYVAQNPGYPLFLRKRAVQLQKDQRPQDAAAFMIWLHTARAGLRLELRMQGRDMWKELSRGFPHVLEASTSFYLASGVLLNTEGACEFPIGLTPEPT